MLVLKRRARLFREWGLMKFVGDWGVVVWEWEGVDDVVWGIYCVVSEVDSLW